MSERMSDQFHGFYVESGETIRLLTAGKYCDKDIYVSGVGGVEDLDEVLTEQESKIAQLQAILDKKAAGSGGATIPDGYHDVSGVTAAAGDVLAGMKFVDKNGNLVDGTIPVITGERSLDRYNDSLEYEGGYYPAALNSAYVDWEDITITPSKYKQTFNEGRINPKAFFRNITVEPIPSDFVQPSGTKIININGTFDVKNYASVNVNVSGGSDDVAISLLTREITSYSNPNLTKLGAYALSGTNISQLSLPALRTIEGYAFYECTKLATVNFPELTAIPYNGMRQFKGLVKADFSALTSIGSNGFYQCTSLNTLIIRTNRVCTLASGSVLSASPILNGTGYIYVPAALKDQYAQSTNWSALADQIRAIEDYPSITGG